MTDPVASDARSGLPPRVFDDLRSAARVYVTPKDSRTTLIGYWAERPAPDRPGTERFGAVVVEGEVEQGEMTHPTIAFNPGRGVAGWKAQVTRLRAGDVLRAHWTPAGLDLWVRRESQRFLLLRVRRGRPRDRHFLPGHLAA
jgi:hypothetical protein